MKYKIVLPIAGCAIGPLGSKGYNGEEGSKGTSESGAVLGSKPEGDAAGLLNGAPTYIIAGSGDKLSVDTANVQLNNRRKNHENGTPAYFANIKRPK